MADSKTKKPRKQSLKFELSFHKATGQYCKKVRQKRYYFGTDPTAALARWEAEKAAILKGEPIEPVKADGYTFRDLCNHFYTDKLSKKEEGELSNRSLLDYRHTTDLLIAHFGKDKPVDSLTALDLSEYRRKLAKTRGPNALAGEIGRVLVVINYAENHGLATKKIMRGDFKKPSKKVFRKLKAKRGSKLFTAAEIRLLLETADVQLRAMILLGIGCGFNPSDCGTLPVDAIDLKRGWIDFARNKTGVDRKCPLWPETIEALQAALDARKNADDKLVFRTKRGQSWYRDDKSAPLSAEFRKLCVACGIHESGRGFYQLRHGLQRLGDEHGDSLATKFLMGHADETISDAYRNGFPEHRLNAVSDYVRSWLYSSESVE